MDSLFWIIPTDVLPLRFCSLVNIRERNDYFMGLVWASFDFFSSSFVRIAVLLHT